MSRQTPQLKELVNILHEPRLSIRRILEAPNRWASEVVVLACVCSSLPDKDARNVDVALPGLSLGSSLALVTLGVILGAVLWVVGVYLFAWMVTLVGRYFGGTGEVADVRAALAWSLVPLIWSVLFRVPVALYVRRFAITSVNNTQVLVEFIRQGGCTLAIIVLAFKLAMFVWMLFIASSTVGEALALPAGVALGTIAIVATAPVVIAIAAALALSV